MLEDCCHAYVRRLISTCRCRDHVCDVDFNRRGFCHKTESGGKEFGWPGVREAANYGGDVSFGVCGSDGQLYDSGNRFFGAFVRQYAVDEPARSMGRLFVHDSGFADSVPVLCGRRDSGTRGKCLEHGFLRVFRGIFSDLSSHSAQQAFREKRSQYLQSYQAGACRCAWLHRSLTAGRLQRCH